MISRATATTDGAVTLQGAIHHCLELLGQLGQHVDMPVEDKVRLRRLRMAAASARGPIELDAIAADIEGFMLNVPTRPPPAQSVSVDAVVASAADAATVIAEATKLPGMSNELRRLAALPPPEPLPPALVELNRELSRVADAVRFCRERGDFMSATTNKLVDELAQLGGDADTQARLSDVRRGLEAASSLDELEALRKQLLQETHQLVESVELQTRSVNSLRELVELHKSHQELLEASLRDANVAARVDALTGLGNRRALDQAVRERSDDTQDVAVALIELDRLNAIVAQHGRSGVDDAVRQLATLLTGELNEREMVFRLEGALFVALLPGLDAGHGAARLRAIVERVAQHPFRLRGSDEHLKASAGVAIWGAGRSFREVMAIADKAHVEAKKAGGGRVKAKR